MIFNPFPKQSLVSRPLGMNLWKTLWEKEKMLVTSIFLLFPQCFLPNMRQKIVIQATSNWSTANASNLVKAIFFLPDKGLNHCKYIPPIFNNNIRGNIHSSYYICSQPYSKMGKIQNRSWFGSGK